MENIFVKDAVEAAGGRLLKGQEEQPLLRISIDSRDIREGDLFIPLIGERNDAHRFIPMAFEKGAAAVYTCEHRADSPELAGFSGSVIQVEDTGLALQQLGAFIRNRLAIPLVGITGSVGKTTTREMVAAALSAGFQVFRTPANHNGQIGVPLTLSEIRAEDEIGVLELGMSEPGEMTVIARLARVDAAVITNVGVAHMENLGTREAILEEKLKIQDGMKPSGPVFLNSDNDLLSQARAREGHETIFFGTGEQADYRAVDVKLEGGCPSFTMVRGERRLPVSLSVMGEHNVLNALAALAVADYYGVPLEAAAEKLKACGGYQNRQQISRSEGFTVLDDTYNASPDSMEAAIRVLSSLEGQRRVAVLADMKELGPEASRFHWQVGAFLGKEPVDLLITLGELARSIAEGARAKRPGLPVFSFSEAERGELEGFLKKELRSGDCVLFKGSNSMKLGELAARFSEGGQGKA